MMEVYHQDLRTSCGTSTHQTEPFLFSLSECTNPQCSWEGKGFSWSIMIPDKTLVTFETETPSPPKSESTVTSKMAGRKLLEHEQEITHFTYLWQSIRNLGREKSTKLSFEAQVYNSTKINSKKHFDIETFISDFFFDCLFFSTFLYV